MASVTDRITELEEEIRRTKYNKATESHIGEIKAKIAKLRREAMKPKSSGGGGGFDIRKSGDSTAVFIGFPSVGKSTLLNKLTNARSEVASYEFTTLTVIPGVLEHSGARIQLLDLPGIISGASQGKGRGREILAVARSSDLLLIILDVFQARTQLDVILRELYSIGIRVNSMPPEVVISPKQRGGVAVNATVKISRISGKTIEKILNVYGIHNAEVVLREDIDDDQFVDVIVANRKYIPALFVLNKCDLVDPAFLKGVKKELGVPTVDVSADRGVNLDGLKAEIYSKLRFMRVYLKPRFGEPDYDAPLVLREGATVGEVCDRIHRSVKNDFRHAFVWGKSARFPGQKVGLAHVLADGDVVHVVKR
jgi:small GTP-binding protein